MLAVGLHVWGGGGGDNKHLNLSMVQSPAWNGRCDFVGWMADEVRAEIV